MTSASDARKVAYTNLLDVATRDQFVSPELSTALHTLAVQVAVDECFACPLGSLTDGRVPWNGVRSSIALVGEAPGAQEEARGVPFVGPSGELLAELMAAAEFTDPVAILNTIACRPPRNDYEYARTVGAPEACRRHLDAQLQAAGAWIVVEVGGKAHETFAPMSGPLSSSVGHFVWRDRRLHTVIYHPSYLLRRGRPEDLMDRMVGVLRRVRQAALGVAALPPVPYQVAVSSDVLAARNREFGSAWHRQGWVPVYSHALGRSVVVYDRDRVRPDDPAVKLPPGLDNPVWFTPDEVVRIGTVDDLRRVAEVKAVLDVEVVA